MLTKWSGKAFGWSYPKLRKVETRAIGISQKLSRIISTFIILYFTLFQEKKKKQRNKRFQISRFVFIPEVNNKLTTAG